MNICEGTRLGCRIGPVDKESCGGHLGGSVV